MSKKLNVKNIENIMIMPHQFVKLLAMKIKSLIDVYVPCTFTVISGRSAYKSAQKLTKCHKDKINKMSFRILMKGMCYLYCLLAIT